MTKKQLLLNEIKILKDIFPKDQFTKDLLKDLENQVLILTEEQLSQ